MAAAGKRLNSRELFHSRVAPPQGPQKPTRDDDISPKRRRLMVRHH
jgi:hypothetical protein